MNRVEPEEAPFTTSEYGQPPPSPPLAAYSPQSSRKALAQNESTFTTITINTAKPGTQETGKPGEGDVDPRLFQSAIAAMFCCGVLGFLALTFGMRSLSASEQQRPRAAKFYADKAMSFAAASVIVGVFFYIVTIVALVLWYYCYYYW